MMRLLPFFSCCESGGCGSSHSHTCGSGCGCSSDNGCGCGGSCSSSQESIFLSFDDGSQYQCPILSIFDINDQDYIALYHPEKQRALLYRFHQGQAGINLEIIEDEAEFELVAKAFRNL